MNYDPLHPPDRPVIYKTPPENHWGSALIVTCFALGVVMSWGTYEVRQRLAEEQNLVGFRHDLDALAGEEGDLGRLMANPRTRLIDLTPSSFSPVRFARVAWNDDAQSGVLFCDDLAGQGQRRYQIWLIPLSGAATAVAFGPVEPGRNVYPFSPTRPAAPPSEIILTPFTGAIELDQAGPALARGKFTTLD